MTLRQAKGLACHRSERRASVSEGRSLETGAV